MSVVRVVHAVITCLALILATACSLTGDSIETRLARHLDLESAVCEPADSDVKCDLFHGGRKVLEDCIVYAGPGASTTTVGAVSGCRSVGDNLRIEGRSWDDLARAFTRAGLQPAIGFPGGDADEEYEVVLDEIDRSGGTIYAAFAFLNERVAASYDGRLARMARLVFGSAGPLDLNALREGATLRRGRLLVWYRKGKRDLTERLGEALLVATTSSSKCPVQVFIRRDAEREEVSAVKRMIEANQMVTRVTYVSPAEGLARMRAKYPKLTTRLPANPLPPVLEVWVRQARFGFEVARRVETLRGAIESVRYHPTSCPDPR